MLDFGDVPGWIEAVATSLAFAGTITLLGIESQRRAEERRLQKEGQASKVAHWLDRDSTGTWSMKYRNVSEVPVYRILIHAYLNDVYMGSEQLNRIHPKAAEQTRDRVNRWLNNFVLELYTEGDVIGLDLVFADANGYGWVRDLDGFLVALPGKRRQPPARLREYKVADRGGASAEEGVG